MYRAITTNYGHLLEIRSVEHGICPIAMSTMNKLFLWPDARRMHETAIFPLPV